MSQIYKPTDACPVETETSEQVEARKTGYDRRVPADLDARVKFQVNQGQLEAAVVELDRRRQAALATTTSELANAQLAEEDGFDTPCTGALAVRCSNGDSCEYHRQHPEPILVGGSQVVTTLERVWDAIKVNHPELPALVIVTGSGMLGSPRWGHTLNAAWVDQHDHQTQDGVTTNVKLSEMFVAGETLAKGASFTLETMLHEAAHVLAWVRGVQDTSRQHRWHNQRFRKLAEELGLEYPKDQADPQIGFSGMVLTPGTAEEYREVVEELDRALRLTIELPGFLVDGAGEDGQQVAVGGEYVHHGRRIRKPSVPRENNLKASCQCPQPRVIRISRRVLEQGFIACGICHQSFETVDGTRAGDQDDA